MKKKLLLAVAMIAMLVCILAISVSASNYDTAREVTLDDGTKVALYDKDGYALTYYLNDSGALTSAKTVDVISVNGNGVATYNGVSTMKVVVANFQGKEIDTLNVKQIPVYYNGANGGEYNTYNDVVEYIYLPDCLTTTVTNQFRCTSKLKIVDITRNSKLETLGQFSFYYATGLVEFYFPPKVKTTPGSGNDGKWGTAATFSYCKSLKNLYFYDNSETETFGVSCFNGCTSLEYVTLPDSLTSTPALLFSGCTALKELKIPNSVTSVGDRIVQGCSNLEKLWYPATMTSIGQSSTYLAGNLQYVYLPSTVTTATGSHHFTTQHTSYKKTVIFYNGTQTEAEAFIALLQSKSNNEKFADGNYAICAWDSTMEDSAYVELATTEKKNYIVYGYNTCKAFYNDVHAEKVEDNNPCWLTECGRCGIEDVYSGNENTHNLITEMIYANYLSNGTKKIYCTNEKCTHPVIDETLDPLFTLKGYSSNKDGEMCVSYHIDIDAIKEYTDFYKDEVMFNYGMVVAANSNNPYNLTENVVKVDLSNNEYTAVDFRLSGFSDTTKDVQIAMNMYVLETKGGTTTVKYLTSEFGTSDVADTITYDTVTKEDNE